MNCVLRAREFQEAPQGCRQGWERLLGPLPQITCITCLLVCVMRPKRWCLQCLLLGDEHETFFTILIKGKRDFPGGSVVKNLLPVQEAWVRSLVWEDPLKEMATHCSIVAWRTLWTEEPGLLQSMGSQRVRHDLATERQQIKGKTWLSCKLGFWWPVWFLRWCENSRLSWNHTGGRVVGDHSREAPPSWLPPISTRPEVWGWSAVSSFSGDLWLLLLRLRRKPGYLKPVVSQASQPPSLEAATADLLRQSLVPVTHVSSSGCNW